MKYSKKPKEPVPEEETRIWRCTRAECQGWMRENFSFAEVPACPLCKSEMTRTTKMLPAIS